MARRRKVDLHALVKRGDVAAVAAGLAAGADINDQNHNGETPLMSALSKDHAALAVLLLDHGADISLKDLGGNTAHDYAFDHPDILARLEAMGAGSGRAESIELPYDRDDFEPGLSALLAALREGAYIVEPHPHILELLKPEPPPDLAALIHTWAYKPESAFKEIGDLWLESRALCRAKKTVLELIYPKKPAEGIIVGSERGGGRATLVASWTRGAARARVDLVASSKSASPLGTLADLVR